LSMIEKIFMTSCFVWFVYACFQPKMIFSFVRNWFDSDGVPGWIKSPLYDCAICMAPWWGSLFYGSVWGGSVREWVIVGFCVGGLNTILVKLFPC